MSSSSTNTARTLNKNAEITILMYQQSWDRTNSIKAKESVNQTDTKFKGMERMAHMLEAPLTRYAIFSGAICLSKTICN